jgi:hypothetical protein
MCAPRRPAHLLLGIHSPMQQPLYRALGDRRRDWFFASTGGRVVNDDIGLSGYVISSSLRRRVTFRAALAIVGVSLSMASTVIRVSVSAALNP